jgi:regulator of protease activity HflC (stomatin/prohibitin superfamily)
MFWFVVVLLLALGGAIAVGVSFLMPKEVKGSYRGDPNEPNMARSVTRWCGVGVLVFASVLFGLTGIRTVPAKSLGVPVVFGSVQPAVGPGIHWRMPYTTMNILDETIQTTTFEGKQALPVRIGGQQTANLDATIQWRIKDQGARALFNNYAHSSDFMLTVEDAVVIREFKTVVNQVLGDYNPIQDVSQSTTSGNSQFSTFGPVVLKRMREDIGGWIDVTSVYMPILHYDTTTQGRLNAIQQQYAATAIATEQLKTNQAQSAANAAISRNLSGSTLYYDCLQIVENAARNNQHLPPAFTCGSGSGAAILVNGK